MPGRSRRKKEKPDLEITDKSADEVMTYLKLHCLRTRSQDAASDFLYGPNPGTYLSDPVDL